MRILSSEFLRDIIMLLGGSAASQALNAVTITLIYAHFPEEVSANYFLSLSISSVVITICSLRVEQAALVDSHNAQNIIRSAILISIGLNLVFMLCGYFFLSMSTSSFLSLVSLNFSWSIFSIALTKLLVQKNILFISLMRLMQAASFLLFVFLVKYIETKLPLHFWLSVAYAIPAIAMISLRDFDFFHLRHGEFFKVIKQSKAYIFLDLPTSTISNLTAAIPLWIIGLNFGDLATAAFGFISRIVYAPVVLLSSAIRDKYKSDSVGMSDESITKLHKMYTKLLAIVSAGLAIVTGALVLILELDRIELITLCALGAVGVIRLNVSSLSFIIYIKRRLDLDVKMHVMLVIALLSLWLTSSYQTYEVFILIYGFIMIVFYLSYLFLMSKIIKQARG